MVSAGAVVIAPDEYAYRNRSLKDIVSMVVDVREEPSELGEQLRAFAPARFDDGLTKW